MYRINRRLRGDDQVLKSSNGARAISDLGHYYVVDFRRGRIARARVELEAFGRELGALAEYECLELECLKLPVTGRCLCGAVCYRISAAPVGSRQLLVPPVSVRRDR